MVTFKQYLVEGNNLTAYELFKYPWRVELFLSKFKKGEPFTLLTGNEIVLKYDDEIESIIRAKTNAGKIIFTGLDSLKYKLSSFAKTAEFGGGSGSGGGTVLTTTTESAQATYAQARWMGATNYDNAALEAAYNSANVNEALQKIQHDLPKAWKDSCIKGAEELFKMFGKKQYQFHRGSAWVTLLEDLFKTVNKKDKHFSNINKWSPADIYMVSSVGASIKLEKADNIVELNNILLKALETQDIIGVSLKLIGKTAKTSFVNFNSTKKVVEFTHAKTEARTTGFFGSKEVNIFFTVDGKIQFRTFPQVFQGEIKGKQANHGKLSYNPINNILKSLKVNQLIDNKKLRKMLESSDDSIFPEFFNNYSKYSNDSPKLTFANFIEKLKEKDIEWVFSKFIGLQLIDIITSNHIENEFVTACVQYASSTSELSAPFLKLE